MVRTSLQKQQQQQQQQQHQNKSAAMARNQGMSASSHRRWFVLRSLCTDHENRQPKESTSCIPKTSEQCIV
jgi:hypothetical protein